MVLIAHCEEEEKDGKKTILEALTPGKNMLIFIGPEGDFSPGEVQSAKRSGAIPITLGTHRLRTETAALAAITHFYLTNYGS